MKISSLKTILALLILGSSSALEPLSSYTLEHGLRGSTKENIEDWQVAKRRLGILSITYRIDEDTFITSSKPTENYDKAKVLQVSKDVINESRSLLKFDFKDTKCGDIISAYLYLYFAMKPKYLPVTLIMNPVGVDWKVKEATWGNATKAMLWTTAGGDYDSSVSVTHVVGTKPPSALKIDAKQIAEHWFTYANNGLIIRDAVPGPDEGTRVIYFTSGTNAKTHIRVTCNELAAKCNKHVKILATTVDCTVPEEDVFKALDAGSVGFIKTMSPTGPFSVGDTTVNLRVSNSFGSSKQCKSRITVLHNPAVCAPIAKCKDAVIAANKECKAYMDEDFMISKIDNGSVGDTMRVDPKGPYPLGTNKVNLIVVYNGMKAKCPSKVKVEDQEQLKLDNFYCGGPDIVCPGHRAIHRPIYNKDNQCPVTIQIEPDFGCSFCNGANKVVDKLEKESCQVSTVDDGKAFEIAETGGVGDFIHFNTQVCGKTGGGCEMYKCTVCTDNPGKDSACGSDRGLLRTQTARQDEEKDEEKDKNKEKDKGQFQCPDGWTAKVDEFKCTARI